MHCWTLNEYLAVVFKTMLVLDVRFNCVFSVTVSLAVYMQLRKINWGKSRKLSKMESLKCRQLWIVSLCVRMTSRVFVSITRQPCPAFQGSAHHGGVRPPWSISTGDLWTPAAVSFVSHTWHCTSALCRSTEDPLIDLASRHTSFHPISSILFFSPLDYWASSYMQILFYLEYFWVSFFAGLSPLIFPVLNPCWMWLMVPCARWNMGKFFIKPAALDITLWSIIHEWKPSQAVP